MKNGKKVGSTQRKNEKRNDKIENNETPTSATRQVRQQWFSVCIFPPGPSFGLTGTEDQR
jgi:hypothetical protein